MSTSVVDPSFLASLRVGDLVDVSDPTFHHWTVGRIVEIVGESIEIEPVILNDHIQSCWVGRQSHRLAPPHSHASTNKNLRPPTTTPATMANTQAHASSVQPSPTSTVIDDATASIINLAISNVPLASPPITQAPPPQQQQRPSSHNQPQSTQPQSSPPTPTPTAASSPLPTMSESELKSFRSSLKLGDLVDFQSERHRSRWFVGEIARVTSNYLGLGQPDLEIFNHSTGEREVIARDSARIWPPMTKSAIATPVTPTITAQTNALPPPAYAQISAGSSGGGAAKSNGTQPVQGRPSNLSSTASHPGSQATVVAMPRPVPSVPEGGVPVSVLGTDDPTLVIGHGQTLAVGDYCDSLDTESKWRLAEITNVNATHVLVHYCHWSTKW